MNKRAILIIVGLMSAALIGLGWLQIRWIRSTVQLNKEKFEKSVFELLNKVCERLEYEEQLQAYNYIENGYSRSFLEKEIRKHLKDSLIKLNFPFPSALETSERLTRNDLYDIFVLQNDCDCRLCKAEREKYFVRWTSFYQSQNYITITERINIEHLNSFMDQELADHGIDLDYNYGIYSKKKQSFVITDGHYVVEDTRPWVSDIGEKNLFNSKFRVNLYEQDGIDPPAYLMVYFPTVASYVWSSVWKMLAAGILFTGIILFSFVYTIQVIILQKKLSKMKTDFINNMTHEFKTPIATISLAADSIKNPKISGDVNKVSRFAKIIKQENRRLNTQVEKVLQMAVVERRDFNLKITGVDIHKIIEQAVEYAILKVESKAGEVTAELKADNPVIKVDISHVTNIINNLLDNAIKYSQEKPEISIHTRNVKSGIEIIIKDKGVGMSKETRKHIFEKFYRVHTGNLHDVKGFGLGLSYVKAMVEAHKGTIKVQSELGKGSSFILYFPFS